MTYVTTYNEERESGVLKLWGNGWSNVTDGENFSFLNGVAADVYGNVFVADSNNQLVKKRSGGVWTAISTTNDFSVPYGVALDSVGNIYVVDNELSRIKKLTVKAETPVIHSGVTDLTTDGTSSPQLSVDATVSDGGTLSYKWYTNTENSMEGATWIEGATESSYTVPTTQAGKLYYYVEVINTNAVAQYKTASVTGLVGIVTVNSSGDTGGSGTGPVITEPTKAQHPQITQQPVDRNVSLNDSNPQLKVAASVNDGGQLSYQWYRNTKKSVESGNIEPIIGATERSYDAPTSTVGITYYFVEVTNTLGETSTTTPSTVATVTVSKELARYYGADVSFIGANGIAVDLNGTVYVISGEKIVKRAIDSDWQDITPADGETREDFYTGIAADSKGTIYVSRYNNGSILKYNGDTWGFIDAEGLLNPSHLAVDEQDQIYVLIEAT